MGKASTVQVLTDMKYICEAAHTQQQIQILSGAVVNVCTLGGTLGLECAGPLESFSPMRLTTMRNASLCAVNGCVSNGGFDELTHGPQGHRGHYHFGRESLTLDQ